MFNYLWQRANKATPAVTAAPAVKAPSAPSAPVWHYPTNVTYVKEFADMLKAPHLLIGGTTGSGKSTVLNGIMVAAITTMSPSKASFILIDPKCVELSQYENLPHVWKYIEDAEDVPGVLDTVIAYMEAEYRRMKAAGIRQSDAQHLYIVIDELADLMISAYRKPIQEKMQKILAKGRAANIHLFACTVAPSRKVIPAELVLNFTNRVALRCLTAIESRQIINVSGAEKITGHGKAMYLSPQKGVETLTGIPYYTDEEIEDRVAFWVCQKTGKARPKFDGSGIKVSVRIN